HRRTSGYHGHRQRGHRVPARQEDSLHRVLRLTEPTRRPSRDPAAGRASSFHSAPMAPYALDRGPSGGRTTARNWDRCERPRAWLLSGGRPILRRGRVMGGGAGPPAVRNGASPTLVGRSALPAARDSRLAANGGVVLTGPSGIGKTALLEAVGAAAAARGE